MCVVFREGWRSAVGRHAHITLHINPINSQPFTSATSASSSSSSSSVGVNGVYSKYDVTIDRFGQEEDVTGARFIEPIAGGQRYRSSAVAARNSVPGRSNQHQALSRRLSKQSTTTTSTSNGDRLQMIEHKSRMCSTTHVDHSHEHVSAALTMWRTDTCCMCVVLPHFT